jgi:hypothetical protein
MMRQIKLGFLDCSSYKLSTGSVNSKSSLSVISLLSAFSCFPAPFFIPKNPQHAEVMQQLTLSLTVNCWSLMHRAGKTKRTLMMITRPQKMANRDTIEEWLHHWDGTLL